MIILPLASPFLFVHGQPQGYTLIYSPPRAYYVDWMDVKAVYMKEEGNRLYFYVSTTVQYQAPATITVGYIFAWILIETLRQAKPAGGWDGTTTSTSILRVTTPSLTQP